MFSARRERQGNIMDDMTNDKGRQALQAGGLRRPARTTQGTALNSRSGAAAGSQPDSVSPNTFDERRLCARFEVPLQATDVGIAVVAGSDDRAADTHARLAHEEVGDPFESRRVRTCDRRLTVWVLKWVARRIVQI